ncbi:flagellar protein FlaG [Idiomarina sp. Sol25]|uniref:flagellar protein FlaG n=1 Tax=Idiomarina sp. Sol25 TaxID=3064000 RepID=UPI00294B288D|nr:flagellar protein FlaG [Idiomarina sp. Sol25]MDV6328625.1 flagellar protein FlaG [Idiomarina sp. Sol25]
MGIEIHSRVSAVGLPNDSEQKSSTRPVETFNKAESSKSLVSEGLKGSERSTVGSEDGNQNIQKVAEELNVNQSIRQHNLKFDVNEDLGRTIVKVIDSETGDLIRQIPSEELVALAERIETQTQESGNSVGYLIDSII